MLGCQLVITPKILPDHCYYVLRWLRNEKVDVQRMDNGENEELVRPEILAWNICAIFSRDGGEEECKLSRDFVPCE